ncbi:MAG: TolB family protein, partial [Blastocatellia bacterium]
MQRRNTLAIVIIGGLIVALWGWLRDTPTSSAALQGLDETVISFRVQFGRQDREPRDWSGTLAATGGEVIALRNWHPRPGDQVQGTSRWTLATRPGANFQRRAWEEEPSAEPVKYLLVPGLIVDVRTTPATQVKFQTPQGEFTVEPRQLNPVQPARLLSGQVEVDRVFGAQKLSDDAYENDFADLLAGPDGEMWLAWVAYRNKGNEVIVRRFNGQAWEGPQTVTAAPADVFLAKLGRDSKGRVWAIWSAQENSNWDLYGRRLEGASWSRVERLTEDAQPDVFHRLASDSRGNLWLVWQGFRNGRSDIFTRRYDGERWSAAEQLSSSPANDWEPAIAADGAGRVYVAWDTYDQGNYDIVMRSFNGAAWEPAVPVANSLKFEAHVSLACDRQNRLWAAWNESGVQWGKDSGFLVKKEATR